MASTDIVQVYDLNFQVGQQDKQCVNLDAHQILA